MMLKRFDAYRASLIAASIASAPELLKNYRTLPVPPATGTIAAISSASRTCGS
jgi:hypothetical protein